MILDALRRAVGTKLKAPTRGPGLDKGQLSNNKIPSKFKSFLNVYIGSVFFCDDETNHFENFLK